jgi:hypothetical protein
MFIKVQGEASSQNLERRRIIHLQTRHVEKDHHVADWKVKGKGFPNLSNFRYAKS